MLEQRYEATTLQRHNATTHVGLTTLQRDINVGLTTLQRYGDIALPVIVQSAHRRGSSSEGFPTLAWATCVLHGDEACALTVCRLINITTDAILKQSDQPSRCFACNAAPWVSWIFCSNKVVNICTIPSGGPFSRISRILLERPMDCNCLNDGTRLRVT